MIIFDLVTASRTLRDPFDSKPPSLNTHHHYMAALFQTIYFLEHKSVPIERFFSSNFRPATATELMEWLESKSVFSAASPELLE